MLRFALASLALIFHGACGEVRPEAAAPPVDRTVELPADGPAAPRVVFLGDSLTAGFGLAEEEAFPAVVEGELRRRGRPIRAVNAGVSGDTSAGGLARLDWLLKQEPDLLVVELGANDGLRGQAVEATEANLRQIVVEAKARNVPVLLLGMRLPPNYGADYVEAFEAIFPRVARELEVPLVPFFLEGVAGVADLNLPDGLHPNAEGHRRAAANLAPWLIEALGEVAMVGSATSPVRPAER